MNIDRSALVPLPFPLDGGACAAMLRSIDWSRHPLGQPQDWPVSLLTIVGILLRSRQPMFVCWGPEHHTIYNDSYADICASRHPASLGARFQDIWPEIWDTLDALLRRTYQGESIHMDDIALEMHRHGYPEETHFSFSYNPMTGDDGRVAGVFCACAETTVQVRLKRELDHQRRQLSQMFEQSPTFIAQLAGRDHVIEHANPAYMQLVGHRDILGKPLLVGLPEVKDQIYIEMLDSVFTSGRSVHVKASKADFQRTPDGPLEERFVDFVYQPVLSSSGKVTGIFVNGVDVTDRIRATADLEASERFLRSVLDASTDCIQVMTLDGRLVYMSDGGRQALEVPVDEMVERLTVADLWRDAGRLAIDKALALAQAGESHAFQVHADTLQGNRKYWDVRVSPMLGRAGHPERVLVVSRDISYLKRIEDEREALTHELSHRMKNAFTMVQAVIGQTLRKAKSVDEGFSVLSGRVRALADAQDILTQSTTRAVSMEDVVAAALAPHRTGDGRFRISGTPAWISGKQGLGLSLALHELATNATKYGALLTTEGQVVIRWDMQLDGTFSFKWEETGGPPVSARGTAGFGTVLIEKIVAAYFDGTATLEFPVSGVRFSLSGKIPDSASTDLDSPY